MRKKKKKRQKRKKKKTIKESKKIDSPIITDSGPFRSVKIPFKTILRNPKRDLPIFNEYAFQINKTMILGYQLVRLYLISKYQNNLPLPEVDEKLYETALSLIINPDRKIKKSQKMQDCRPELKLFFDTEFRPLIKDQNLPTISNVSTTLQKLRVEMVTSFKNNLSMRYYSRLSHLIGILLDREIYGFNNLDTMDQKKIHSKTLKAVLLRDLNKVEVRYHLLVKNAIKKYVPGSEWTKHLAYDLLTEPMKFFLPTLEMENTLEELGKASFQSIPLRSSCIPKYFPINSITLVNLMDCEGIIGTKNIKNKTELASKIGQNKKLKWILWNYYFKMDKKVFKQKNYNFFYSIDTDAFGTTLKFLKEGNEYKKYSAKSKEIDPGLPEIASLTEEEAVELLDHPFVGGDPGKLILLQLVGPDKKTLRYTQKQRWAESQYHKNAKNRIAIKTAERIQILEQPLNDFNSKSINVAEFKKFIKAKAEISLQVESHFQKIIYRKLKYRSRIKSKQSMLGFINKIQETFGDDAVIGYGNWSRSSQMKGLKPTPGTTLRNEVARKCRCFDIDEFRSSSYCCYCHKKIKHRYVKGKKLHRVLVCRECSGPQDETVKVRYTHRDVTGGANIRKFGLCELQGIERPVVFQRPKDETKSKTVVPSEEQVTNGQSRPIKKVPLIRKKTVVKKKVPDKNGITQGNGLFIS